MERMPIVWPYNGQLIFWIWDKWSPLEFPLGNGDPGGHHFLESRILWIAHFYLSAFFREILVAIW